MTDASISNTNALELSDEEFEKLDFDAVIPSNDSEEEEELEEETEVETEEEDVALEEETTEEEADDDEEAEDEDVSTPEGQGEQQETQSKKKVDDASESDDTVEDESSEINYKEAYEKVFAPFKANGKEIKVQSPEDAITLMQMGANYAKKMAGLKPNLKLLKMLENNNLLSEDKLNYLIDLDKKNPQAITKLLKDSGVDPLDIDTDKPVNYKPNTYTVDDKSVELDGILDDIRDTKSFNETLDIIGNKWDIASKKVLSSNPNIIKIINEHVDTGIYHQIQQIVDNERMFGRLEGLSDLEAYKQVGDAINAQGGFAKPANTSQSILNRPNANTKTKAVDPKLKSRKKAASSTKSTASSKSKDDFNPLALSDDEFEKLLASKYM